VACSSWYYFRLFSTGLFTDLMHFPGFGAVPACLALYYRLTIPETPRYTFDIARDVEKARYDVKAYMTGKHEGVPPSEIKRLEILSQADSLVLPKASFGDFMRYFGKWNNAKTLIGAAGSWFCLDVAFYGLGLNSSTVLGAIGWTGGSNVYQILYKVASGNIILVCAGALPGYWATMFTVDIIGRKPIQMMGFIILTLLFLVWGFDYEHLSSNSMLGIYILAQFFFNFGERRPLSSSHLPLSLRYFFLEV
jgi:PHS family inorganic phosphate transporter-like MFS transporter